MSYRGEFYFLSPLYYNQYMKEKRCYICGKYKSLDEFHRDTSQSTGFCSRCKICHNKRRLERQRKNIAPLRIIIEEAKRKGCFHCGELNPVVLDTHHLHSKTFNFSAVLNGSRKAISDTEFKKELTNCVILCANCHRRVTRGDLVL